MPYTLYKGNYILEEFEENFILDHFFRKLYAIYSEYYKLFKKRNCIFEKYPLLKKASG